MKKIGKVIKNNYKIVLGIVIGILITGTTVYAATSIAGKDITYSNTISGLSATTVQGAIDEIYEKSKTHCPEGYKCEKNYICKRATTLHTEKCAFMDATYYCSGDGYVSGDTITYGNLGTSGTLTTGDAFDCDVNGDGIYDEVTERFYYVSDMTNGVTTDSNTAVLIYYNNVSGGIASNSTAYAYDSSGSNNNGPVTAIEQLPTIFQWKNVSLRNTTRTITNESGENTTSAGNLPTAFSYEGYAARLLTAQEVSTGCGFTLGSSITGKLSTKCKFLMENTQYSSSTFQTDGPWLETPNSYSSSSAFYVSGVYNTIGSGGVVHNVGNFGVRPVIEVAKSNISY